MDNKTKEFTLYLSDVRQRASNTYYPHPLPIRSAEDLRRAALVDHVGARFEGYKRGDKRFRAADVVIMDLDNDGAQPGQGLTPEDVQRAFPGVQFWAVPSRSHGKPKEGRPPQPRHHYYFPLAGEITDAGACVALKKAVQNRFPAFDANACDASRFIYGVESPQPLLYSGDLCVDEYVQQAAAVADKTRAGDPGVIPEGGRNNTLSAFAFSMLKRYGEDDGRAEAAFREKAARCDPPLPVDEIETVWRSACKAFREKILPSSGYLTPKEYLLQQLESTLEPADYSDVGQAKVLASLYASRLAYSEGTGFLIYDGSRWEESEIGALGLAQDLTDRQLEEARAAAKAAYSLECEADAAGKGEAKKARKRAEAYQSFAMKQRVRGKLEAALSVVRPMVAISTAQLDADGYLLNTPGGTVDLRTGGLRLHDPADHCTKITGCAPDAKGADVFAGFLAQITAENPDLARYIQEVAGMAAVGKVLRENLIIAYGTGGNGKSTFFNLLARVLGDYAGTLSAEVLTASCRKNKSPEFAELRGRRLVIAAELEEGLRLDSAALKQLCSTDPVHAEKKFKPPFDFIPSHTIVLYTNHLPKVGTNDRGTWDRLVVIPFQANFRGAQGEVKNYAERLFECCGGAVLSWIIEGARRFLAAGGEIEAPECVRAAVEQYQADNDWLSSFIAARCVSAPAYQQPAGALYEDYRAYCYGTGERFVRSPGDFNQALRAAGYGTKKTKAGSIVYGLKLRTGAAFYTAG